MIEGRPDNAPRNAATILLMFTPLIYIVLGFLNGIDALFDRWGGRNAWLGSIVLCGLLSLLFLKMCYRPGLDSSPFIGIGMAILTGSLSLLPMTLVRRFLFRRGSRFAG